MTRTVTLCISLAAFVAVSTIAWMTAHGRRAYQSEPPDPSIWERGPRGGRSRVYADVPESWRADWSDPAMDVYDVPGTWTNVTSGTTVTAELASTSEVTSRIRGLTEHRRCACPHRGRCEPHGTSEWGAGEPDVCRPHGHGPRMPSGHDISAAVAAERARIRAAVEALPVYSSDPESWADGWTYRQVVDRAAVLAAIEGEPT